MWVFGWLLHYLINVFVDGVFGSGAQNFLEKFRNLGAHLLCSGRGGIYVGVCKWGSLASGVLVAEGGVYYFVFMV